MAAVASYAGFRYPVEIISHAVWLYFRFSLSFRDVSGCCCISGRAGTVGRGLVRCSDGEGQFGERCWDPVVGVEVNGQFVMTAAQVLDERMSCTDHSG